MFKNFVAAKISRQISELFASNLIITLATAMVAIFEPIYLYVQGFSLVQILYFFLAVYAAYFLLMPLGAKFARRYGYEKAMYLASPFLIGYYVFLYLIPTSGQFIWLAIAALVMQKVFYWPAYHADFARFGRSDERGREVGNLLLITSLVSIVAPFLGGLVVDYWGWATLFVCVSILILASNLPMITTSEKFKPKPFSYWHAYRRLFYAENRRNFFGFLGFGEELIVLVIWPVFIYTVLKDFLSVGSLVAVATLITTLVLLYVGRMADGDSGHRRALLKIGSIFYAAAWWLRLLAAGPLSVFLVDTLSRITKDVVVVPMMAMTYDHASETSVMKTVVFFEMSLVAGKIIAILISLLVLNFLPNSFAAMFVIAALMSLLYSLVKYNPVKVK